MSTAAIGLVLVSAFIHASWNVMARRSRAETKFIAGMLPFVAAVGFFPAAAGQVLTHAVSGRIWLYVSASGLCCAVYFHALGRAYESGDFTTVYPVARALPVLLVAVGDVFRGAFPSGMGWLGMALVVAGCIIAPLSRLRDLSWRQYLNRASLWMSLTGLGTVGYSILDKRGVELLRPGPLTAAIYCYFFYLFSFAGYALIVLLLPRGSSADASGTSWWLPATAGVMSFVGYFLVLWAFQLVDRASYVVAFRQASLVIGVLMAFAMDRRERYFVRLLAVLVITAGLVLITLYG